MNYFVAIGTPFNHSGLECSVECELQIGDYVEMFHEENEGEDEGEMVVITHRYYCVNNNNDDFIFYAKRINKKEIK